MEDNSRIVAVNIEEQMKTAYIDYSMSVIVSRALPDVRDGLKPVHRRVLFGMSELGVHYNKAHKKSARIVGEVLGKYHPHGDSSVYDTMVRMAQDWSLRYPLVDGQGNFGSMDGDSPAAMRYTEARLRRISDELLDEINKDTVRFAPNFDDSLEEPTVLPARYPNLLVNGATGIAVGMATNMLPHNLSEIIDGTVALIDNAELTITELMQFITAPDFPTGGIIHGIEGIREAFETGRGRVVVRGRAEIEAIGGRETIIITEIPYQVNKAMLVSKIADLVNEKRIEGVSDVRDESDRNGVRVVVEVKRDSAANVVLNMLYKLTPLQSSYGVNNVCLVNGRPMILNLKQIIEEFIKFRLDVIVRRTNFDLRKARERAHILEGFYVALDDLDRIITLIRQSKNVEDASIALTTATFKLSEATATLVGVHDEAGALKMTYNLSDIQAKAILEMRLQRLTGMERDKVKGDYEETRRIIADLEDILGSETRRRLIIKTELGEIKDRFGDKRRTAIEAAEGEISMTDLISNEEMVVTLSHLGYAKRTNIAEFKAQGRGGRGSRGAKTRNEDFLEHMFIASAHDYLMFFTNRGKCYWLRAYEIPEGTKTSTGRNLQNILSLQPEEKVRAYVKIKDLTDVEFINNNYIVFCTKNGQIKKTLVEDYSRPRANGILAIGIADDDELLEAKLTNGNNEILLANRNGRAIRFNESRVRKMGRTASGVIGMQIDEGGKDAIVGMICVDPEDKEQSILVVSENGYGKRSELDDYPVQNRGGKGVRTIKVTEKTGTLVTIKTVRDVDDLVITTKSGITIRSSADNIRVMGRSAQGVRVIRLDDGEEIADVALIRDGATMREEAAAELAAFEAAENALENGETTAENATENGESNETPIADAPITEE